MNTQGTQEVHTRYTQGILKVAGQEYSIGRLDQTWYESNPSFLKQKRRRKRSKIMARGIGVIAAIISVFLWSHESVNRP